MQLKETVIKGVFEIDMFHAEDDRGSFTKTFQQEQFKEQGLVSDFRESFYSTNRKNVIRGMHFQHPPHDHAKLVYVTSGSVLDVILDLRKSSPTYGKHAVVEISATNHKGVYMSSGVAHGFCCLTEATMIYLTSTVHHPASDDGIRWDSFGMNWPINQGILSERDKNFQMFDAFKSPF